MTDGCGRMTGLIRHAAFYGFEERKKRHSESGPIADIAYISDIAYIRTICPGNALFRGLERVSALAAMP